MAGYTAQPRLVAPPAHLPPPHGDLEGPVPVLFPVPVVEVRVAVVPRLPRSLEEQRHEAILVPRVLHAHGTLGTMVLARSPRVRLSADEPRQHVPGGPALDAPRVVVRRRAAVVERRVGRRGAAQEPPAGLRGSRERYWQDSQGGGGLSSTRTTFNTSGLCRARRALQPAGLTRLTSRWPRGFCLSV